MKTSHYQYSGYTATIFLLILLSLTGCETVNLNQPYNQSNSFNQQVDSIRLGVEELKQIRINEWNEPKYDPIRDKMTPIEDEITFQMLASNEVAREEHKELIAMFAEFELKLNQQKIQFMKESGFTDDYVTIIESGLNYQIGTLLELYQQRISYGEAMVRVKSSNNQRRADLAELDRLYAQKNIEAQQQAAMLAQKRQDAYLNYLSNYNLQQQLLRQQHGTLNCNQMGSFTTCRY